MDSSGPNLRSPQLASLIPGRGWVTIALAVLAISALAGCIGSPEAGSPADQAGSDSQPNGSSEERPPETQEFTRKLDGNNTAMLGKPGALPGGDFVNAGYGAPGGSFAVPRNASNLSVQLDWTAPGEQKVQLFVWTPSGDQHAARKSPAAFSPPLDITIDGPIPPGEWSLAAHPDGANVDLHWQAEVTYEAPPASEEVDAT